MEAVSLSNWAASGIMSYSVASLGLDERVVGMEMGEDGRELGGARGGYGQSPLRRQQVVDVIVAPLGVRYGDLS